MTKTKQIASLENFPKAQELIQSVFGFQYNVVFYGGAIRGGKTFNCLLALVLLLRMFPGSRAAIIRKDMEMLKRSTLPTVKKVFPENFIRLKNSTSYIWECNNQRYGGELNSEVFFFGENYEKDKELTRWDGLEVNFILMDQVEGMTQAGFTKALERVGAYFIPGIPKEKQPPPIILASLNPAKNWIKPLVYDRWIADTLPPTWKFIQAKITDNPHVPQGYLDSLEQMRITSPKEYTRRVEGDWNYGDDPSALIKDDSINNFFTNDFIDGKNELTYISADVARYGGDKSVILVWRGLAVVDYVVMDKNSLDEFSAKVLFLSRKYNVPRSRIIIDSDGIGAGPVDTVKSKAFVAQSSAIGFHTTQNNQKIPNRDLFDNLKTQCGYKLAELMNADLMSWILKDEEHKQATREELAQVRERYVGADRKKSLVRKEEIKLVLGRSSDFSDTILMRMFFELKKRPNMKAHF